MDDTQEQKPKAASRDRDIFLLLRQIKGVPIKDVASRAGIGRQTVVNMRKPIALGGTRYPRHETMKKIARAFGMRWRLTDSAGNFLR